MYDSEEGTWNQESKLVAFDSPARAQFGSSLVRSGNSIWVGAPYASGFIGAVYIYDYDIDAGAWSGSSKLWSSDTSRGQAFAGSIAVDGDVAIIGAASADHGLGKASIFERSEAGKWEEVSMLLLEEEGMEAVVGAKVDCEEGSASLFDCEKVDLLSFKPISELGGGRGVHVNDVWGWTDPESGVEYVLLGRMDGTSFVDISDPSNPVLVGDLPLTEGATPNAWRDIKVYNDHAFIVADGAGQHGMQVFDLRQLRDVSEANMPVTFEQTAHYDKIASAHNIVINEDSGYAFSVGSSSGGETCGGGLHMINIQNPLQPTFAGCFADPATGRASTGYTHDAQCVNYKGPDADFQGHEICFNANETALSIADVTDKDSTIALSRASYPNVGYSHQGWLTEDQKYFYMNDELDELSGNVKNTRTLIWDVQDLEDPQLLKEFFLDTESTDHNLYIKGNLMYQSNYYTGLRILDISDIQNPVEVGHFDTTPFGENGPGFDGSWSNYPYFKSGVIAVSSIGQGLFLVKTSNIDI
jgi:choice-of-anchor B domain-containing protein